MNILEARTMYSCRCTITFLSVYTTYIVFIVQHITEHKLYGRDIQHSQKTKQNETKTFWAFRVKRRKPCFICSKIVTTINYGSYVTSRCLCRVKYPRTMSTDKAMLGVVSVFHNLAMDNINVISETAVLPSVCSVALIRNKQK